MENSFENIMHHDYLEVCKMRSSIPTKVRLLTIVFSQNPDTWRVVGVTQAALKVFQSHDFQKKSGIGVNRSHLVDRDSTYRKMLEKPIKDFNEWWQFYYENDKCVLATSGENNSVTIEDIIDTDESLGLFKSQGFAWKHRKRVEAEFLRKLYEI